MGKASKKKGKGQRRPGAGPSRAGSSSPAGSNSRTGSKQRAGGRRAAAATSVPATIPQWPEGSLGDYFFQEMTITRAAPAAPLAEAVLPAPEDLLGNPMHWEAATNVLIRAVVLDEIPADDPAIGAIIDRLAPVVEVEAARFPQTDENHAEEFVLSSPLAVVGEALLEATRTVIGDDRIAPVLALLESRLDAATARALVCAVAHDYFFEAPQDTDLLDRLDEDSSTTRNALEALVVEKHLAPGEALGAGLRVLALLAGLCRTTATSILGPR